MARRSYNSVYLALLRFAQIPRLRLGTSDTLVRLSRIVPPTSKLKIYLFVNPNYRSI